jgi:hypothetical protein
MKIRNLVFATAGAASLALVLSACGEPAANNSNMKPVNTMPVNTSTPMNTAPMNTAPSNMTNANHGNTTTAPMNSNTKPMNSNTNMATPKKP